MSLAAEALIDRVAQPTAAPQRPIVVVGNGPVGMHAVGQLLHHLPAVPIVVYGDEHHPPYDRVRLSACLAGDAAWHVLERGLPLPAAARVEQRLGCRVTAIDPQRRLVRDSAGGTQHYRRLILATGSRPHVPNLPGIGLPGVFTFRTLDDASRLIARRSRSHHTIVLGGGLLGLEAARGMQRSNTRVTVIEHSDRLMGRQLDEAAAERLAAAVQGLGIAVLVGAPVRRVLGEARVEGVELASGRRLPCDTLVVATGIRPNIELARDAGLAHGRGIRVDDRMRTSVEDVYAIGECAEHRGQVYGLVAPGREQAAVAAAAIAGMTGRYRGSVAASRLKVVGVPVFSAGPMGAGEAAGYGRDYVYTTADGLYRRLRVHRHRLVGALALGECPEANRLQSAVAQRARVWPWQVWRFRRRGFLWPAQHASGVAHWPAAATLCQCTGVTRGAVGQAIAGGACSAAALSAATGAGTVCGSCRPLLQELLGHGAPAEPMALHRSLLSAAAVALLATLAIVLLPALPYADSVREPRRWDGLWREGLAKQISGFSALGLFALGLLLSPRKRLRPLQRLGRFDVWRLFHAVLGPLTLIALLAHTGMRVGHGLNAYLFAAFMATLGLGSLTTAAIALEHSMAGGPQRRWRERALWWHILLFWPVPVLLGFHVLKSYWY